MIYPIKMQLLIPTQGNKNYHYLLGIWQFCINRNQNVKYICIAGVGAIMLPARNILKLCREFQRNETFDISPPSNCQAAGLGREGGAQAQLEGAKD